MKIDPYILTVTGNHFDFIELKNNKIDIEEIAYALSNTCRFGGHCKQYYSVAQHSVLVAQRVPSWCYMDALFHDAAEAYLGDMPTPLKQLLPDYKNMTHKVEFWLQQKMGINIEQPEIKKADLEVLAAEKRDLMPPDTCHWMVLDGITTPDEEIVPMLPATAFQYFMSAYEYGCNMEKE